jgi:ABC-type uncharacterized transport system fused permease/ATPase subunit
VVLFTHSLSRVMGYRSQLVLYAYYIAVAHLLRALAPPLATMAAQEAGLSGSFRAAHQRLVAHAEEVAFNDPPAGAAERLVLNQHLRRLIKYVRLSSLQRFLQQVRVSRQGIVAGHALFTAGLWSVPVVHHAAADKMHLLY